jgi:hypothetical protein
MDNVYAGNGADWEPRWPTGDPAALIWWLEEGGQAQFGRNLNKWLGLLHYTSSQIWSVSSSSDRKKFREAALTALEAGRNSGAIPSDVYTEQEIYIRMSYFRNSDDSLSWRKTEMEQIVDIFIRSIPMDITSAREKCKLWRNQPISVIKSLRNAKNLLALIEPGISLLDGDKSTLLMDWLKIRPQLP